MAAPGFANAIMFSCICGVVLMMITAATTLAASHQLRYCKQQLETKQRITLYGQEILNKNSFRVLFGLADATVPGAPLLFGTVFVANYPLFPTYNFSDIASAQGIMRGTHTIVSYSGTEVFYQMNVVLKDPLPVGTLAMSGVFSYADTSLPVAIVGGTGAYYNARGNATVTPIDANIPFDESYRIDFDLDLLSDVTTTHDEELLLSA